MSDLFPTPGKTDVANTDTASVVAVEQDRAMAEVKAAMSVAISNPRHHVRALDRILQECQRPTLAEVATYAYPRGGQQVTGPSIRLAEALARNWGNVDFGVKEIENRGGRSVLMAYAWDLETNTRATKTFTVPHERYTKQGAKQLTDPRDIYEAVANQGARRMRACILSIIPGDVIESALTQCDETLRNAIGAPEETIAKMITQFEAFGVTKQMIEKRLGHRIEATVAAEILSLRKIYLSIKDGFSKTEDWFEYEIKAEVKAKQSAKEKVVQKADKLGSDDLQLSGE